MNIKEILISEIENTPEPVLSEVLDFVCFLKEKKISGKNGYSSCQRSIPGKGLAEN